MKPMPRARPRWTLWRLLRWGAAMGAILVLGPFLVWWIANRIDERPTAEALDYAAPSPRQVADADNAWLMLVGIGAAPDADPIQLGRRRVDRIEARYQQVPSPPPDADEVALFTDAVAAVGPDAAVDGFDELCSSHEVDCITWAGSNQGALYRLQEVNALRLARSEAALKLPGWQAHYREVPGLQRPDFTVLALQRNLLALELSRTATSMPANAVPIASTALERMADVVDFWHRVLGQPQDLGSTLLAMRQIELYQRLADQWVSRRVASAGAREDAALDRILAPLPGPIDWHEAMRGEYQYAAKFIGDEFDSSLRFWQVCKAADARQGCIQTFLMYSSVAPQATLNLRARHLAIMESVLEAEPANIDAAHAEAGPALEETFLDFNDTGRLLRQFAYNPAGRILAQAAIPVFDWGRRLHDQENLRRMIVLKRRAQEQRWSRMAMPGFLEEQPVELRNSLTGAPFGWDAETGEITYVPSASKYWKSPELRVAR